MNGFSRPLLTWISIQANDKVEINTGEMIDFNNYYYTDAIHKIFNGVCSKFYFVLYYMNTMFKYDPMEASYMDYVKEMKLNGFISTEGYYSYKENKVYINIKSTDPHIDDNAINNVYEFIRQVSK